MKSVNEQGVSLNAVAFFLSVDVLIGLIEYADAASWNLDHKHSSPSTSFCLPDPFFLTSSISSLSPISLPSVIPLPAETSAHPNSPLL